MLDLPRRPHPSWLCRARAQTSGTDKVGTSRELLTCFRHDALRMYLWGAGRLHQKRESAMPSPRLPGCLFQDKKRSALNPRPRSFPLLAPPESPPTFASGKGSPPRYPENLAALTKEVPGRAPLASQIAVMLRFSENIHPLWALFFP
jgi:hypothetical protein